MDEKKTKRIETAALPWPALIPGVLIKRYKRFLADVRLDSGRIVTAHCPNSGSMRGCSEPGRKVYLSYHDNPKRKLKYTWELIEMPASLVGINTLTPNRLVKKSVAAGAVAALCGYDNIYPEVKTTEGSRLDLLLTGRDKPNCYVEIKNCTLVEDGSAFFPDAVTARGRKHLKELQRLAGLGHLCVMFYLIQRMDAKSFQPATQIDPAYARELKCAVQNGIEILVYDVRIDLQGIALNNPIAFLI